MARKKGSSKGRKRVVKLKSDISLDVPLDASKVRNNQLFPKKNNPFLGDF